MKRKLLPLLVIAFVVAVIATGIFYGLIAGKLRNAGSSVPQGSLVVAARNLDPGTVLQQSDVKMAPWAGKDTPKGAFTGAEQLEGWTVLQPIPEGEPLFKTRLASRDMAGGAALAVPAGMRAVSLQVTDSPGVVRMLRPGHRVDVQAVRVRGGARGGEAELRTILHAVLVLAVPAETKERSSAPAVLTVLAKPGEAETLGVADAGARIRVVLRNPLDEEKPAAPLRELATLFQDRGLPAPNRVLRASAAAPAAAKAASGLRSPPGATDDDVRFQVRFAGAEPAALEEFQSRLVAPRKGDQLQVLAFRPDWDVDGTVHRLQLRKQVQVVSAWRLSTGNNRAVAVEARGVRIQLLPRLSEGGRLRLRVAPEAASGRMEAEIELVDRQSVLVTGLPEKLVVLVKPQLLRPAPSLRPTSASLARP